VPAVLASAAVRVQAGTLPHARCRMTTSTASTTTRLPSSRSAASSGSLALGLREPDNGHCALHLKMMGTVIVKPSVKKEDKEK